MQARRRRINPWAPQNFNNDLDGLEGRRMGRGDIGRLPPEF